MALSSTGTAVADGVYTDLFRASAPYSTGSDGAPYNRAIIRVTAGTATIKVAGTAYVDTARTMSSSDDPWDCVPLNGSGPITFISAAGSGGAATVAFYFP